MQNEAQYFVAETDAQSLSVLSHDTLMMLLEKLEGKPGWATVYKALSIQEGTALYLWFDKLINLR
jgi:hypothetical protein